MSVADHSTQQGSYPSRTMLCGAPREDNIGKTLTLCGWVETRRDHGGVIFIDLRDHSGLVQVVFKPDSNPETHQQAQALRQEYVIAVQGEMIARNVDMINPRLATGQVELLANSLWILNTAEPAPYALDEDVEEKLRLTHRHYDLRRQRMQHTLRVRSEAARLVRQHYHQHDFVEIETPVLTKATPEGARDYLVPSRVNRGQFYALPQSPQLFKQLLMVGGFDRYYQIVRCFRDEDLRGNRQPEFTQIDVELAFATPQQVMKNTEGLIRLLFSQLIEKDIPQPIPRLTWQQAMDDYGSDAPDLRFEMPIRSLSALAAQSGVSVFANAVEKGGEVKGLCVKAGASTSRGELDQLTAFAIEQGAKGMAWVKKTAEGWQSPIAKFFAEGQQQLWESVLDMKEGDLAIFCADQSSVVTQVLSTLRLELGRRLGLIDEDAFAFAWITDFPMFEKDKQTGRLHAMHHPFTAPDPADLAKYADTDPLKISAQAYDLVLNGVELGGGSIRNHQSDIQEQILSMLGMDETTRQQKFGFLLKALCSGAPPHGGIALGFDRIIMSLTKAASIREVIAFPKTQKATDLLLEAPSAADPIQLRELGLLTNL